MGKPRKFKIEYLIAVLLVLATAAVYWQVVGFDFVNFDDNMYVSENTAVRHGLSKTTIHWAFTTFYQSNWHPLTWISLMFDTDVAKTMVLLTDVYPGKDNSAQYHLTNVILHILNTLLLFHLIVLLTGERWKSAFVAAIFAVHPLHVESVAWVAERKDVLSTFFWMLTSIAYVSYVRRPMIKRFVLVVLFFVFGLMAKPMLVSLPIVLLLMDIWPLNRLDLSKPKSELRTVFVTLLREKAVLFIISFVSCIVTIWAQRAGGAVDALAHRGMTIRIENALVSYMSYTLKTIWPAKLAVLYPHPDTHLPFWQVAGSILILIAITIWCIRSFRDRPYLTVGWAWFIITLIPVIGILQVGKQAMADRYMYIPMIGLTLMIAWGIQHGVRLSRLWTVFAVIAIIAMIPVAHIQTRYWQNSVTLFTRTIDVTTRNPLAHNNLGNALKDRSEYEAAVAQYKKAIAIVPEYVDANYNLGNAYAEMEKIDLAIRQYRKVLGFSQGQHISANNNLGIILAQQGKYHEAAKHLKRVLELDPNNASALNNLEMIEEQLNEKL